MYLGDSLFGSSNYFHERENRMANYLEKAKRLAGNLSRGAGGGKAWANAYKMNKKISKAVVSPKTEASVKANLTPAAKKGIRIAEKMAKGAMVGGVATAGLSAAKKIAQKPIKKMVPGGTGYMGKVIEKQAMESLKNIKPNKKITDFVSKEDKKKITESLKKPSIPSKKLTPSQEKLKKIMEYEGKKPRIFK